METAARGGRRVPRDARLASSCGYGGRAFSRRFRPVRRVSWLDAPGFRRRRGVFRLFDGAGGRCGELCAGASCLTRSQGARLVGSAAGSCAPFDCARRLPEELCGARANFSRALRGSLGDHCARAAGRGHDDLEAQDGICQDTKPRHCSGILLHGHDVGISEHFARALSCSEAGASA